MLFSRARRALRDHLFLQLGGWILQKLQEVCGPIGRPINGTLHQHVIVLGSGRGRKWVLCHRNSQAKAIRGSLGLMNYRSVWAIGPTSERQAGPRLDLFLIVTPTAPIYRLGHLGVAIYGNGDSIGMRRSVGFVRNLDNYRSFANEVASIFPSFLSS